MPNFISEAQIERALVQKLQHLHGYDVLDCHSEDPEDFNDGSGRAHKRDVILVDRLREAMERLNPDIPAPVREEALEKVLEKVLDRRAAMTRVAANQEVYGLLRDGIPVEFDDAQGRKQKERVRLLDLNGLSQNRYWCKTGSKMCKAGVGCGRQWRWCWTSSCRKPTTARCLPKNATR